MEINYQYIDIPNYNNIKNEIYDKINVLYPNVTSLFEWQPTNSLVPTEVNELIENFGAQIRGCCVNCTTNSRSPIHVDTGKYHYSLNLPIANCEKTFIKFYHTQKEPQLIKTTNVQYWGFNDEDVDVLENIETNKPLIVNTKVAHSFESFQIKPRIMLLIRFEPGWNLENICY